MIGSLLIPIWVHQGKVMSSIRWIYRESDELRSQLTADGMDSDVNNYTSPISLEVYKQSNLTTVVKELYPIFNNASYSKFLPKDNLPYQATIKPIAGGTLITPTSVKFTFLCSKCLTGDALTSAFTTDGAFGFAAAQVPPPIPEDAHGRLQYHLGFSGSKVIALDKAKNSNFGQIASLAGS
jgi:Cytochrome domain of cellobiose dehydrogenase